jgi:hypothetical protein
MIEKIINIKEEKDSSEPPSESKYADTSKRKLVECPLFDSCGGVYGCPEDYETCIEYHRI